MHKHTCVYMYVVFVHIYAPILFKKLNSRHVHVKKIKNGVQKFIGIQIQYTYMYTNFKNNDNRELIRNE